MGYLYRRCSLHLYKNMKKEIQTGCGTRELGTVRREGTGGQYTRAQFNGVIAESVQHNAFYKLPKAISKPTFFSAQNKNKKKKNTEKAQTKFFAHSRLLTRGWGRWEGGGV